MLLRIEHETRLTYTEPVAEAVIEVRMAPESSEDQTVLGYRLRALPAGPATPYRDGFGNRVELLNVLAPHRELVLRAISFVRTHRRPASERLTGVTLAESREPSLEALEFLQPSRLVGQSADLDALAEPLRRTDGPAAEALLAAVAVTRDRLKYEKRVTTARTPVEEALRLGRGVCQDFAHLLIGLSRAAGLPARYVSGYVHQPGEIETHAWCQVWGGPAGWVDVDPTQGRFVGPDHVVTAVGRDYADVPPNRGVWKGQATESMSVTVQVEEVERVPPDSADVGGSWAGAAAAVGRPVRPSGTVARTQARLLYRHQQEQQQQTDRW
jgi:transglutaminase-like putative cysteine protease